jgi:hypothetical protein
MKHTEQHPIVSISEDEAYTIPIDELRQLADEQLSGKIKPPFITPWLIPAVTD